MVALQLIKSTPALTGEFYDHLRSEEQLREVILLILHIQITQDHSLGGISVKLYLVAYLQLTFGPTVGEIDKLQQTHVLQTELQLYLFLFHIPLKKKALLST